VPNYKESLLAEALFYYRCIVLFFQRKMIENGRRHKNL